MAGCSGGGGDKCIDRSIIYDLLAGKDRVLIEAVCFCPVKIFTDKALEIAVSCWEWLLTARKDLEDEVIWHVLLKLTCFSRTTAISKEVAR